MRGVQKTDRNGVAVFQTVYPGWYQGRTVHIHVKVHVGGNVVHTGQLFFSDTLTDAVYKRSPYSRRPNRDVRNAQDMIYQSGGPPVDADRAPQGHGLRRLDRDGRPALERPIESPTARGYRGRIEARNRTSGRLRQHARRRRGVHARPARRAEHHPRACGRRHADAVADRHWARRGGHPRVHQQHRSQVGADRRRLLPARAADSLRPRLVRIDAAASAPDRDRLELLRGTPIFAALPPFRSRRLQNA